MKKQNKLSGFYRQFRMGAIFSFVLSVSASSHSIAQSPCALVSSIVINTGYNPVTGTAIGAPGFVDPNWYVSSLSSDCQAVCSCPGGPAGPAVTVTPLSAGWPYNWVTNPASQWLSFYNSTGYKTTAGKNYYMTLSRNFKLCAESKVTLSMQMADDNYDSVYIDNTLVYSQPTSNVPGNYNVFTPVTSTQTLTAGTHTLNVKVVNESASMLNNAHGLNIVGTLTATGPYLAGPASPENCNCTGMPCDATATLAAVFGSTGPLFACQFNCSASTTAGSGWTPISYTWTTIYSSVTTSTNTASVSTPNGSAHVLLTLSVTFTNSFGDICVRTATKHLDCNGGNGFVYRQSNNNTAAVTAPKGIQVYPNPTQSIITVSSDAENIDHVAVIDFTGRVIKDYTFSGKNSVDISMQKMPAGTYIIKVNDKESKLINKIE